MTVDPRSLNPGTLLYLVPRWWDPRIYGNSGPGINGNTGAVWQNICNLYHSTGVHIVSCILAGDSVHSKRKCAINKMCYNSINTQHPNGAYRWGWSLPSLVPKLTLPWWRHQMDTFSALLAPCAGNSSVTGEFPAQRPVTWSFDVFFYLCPNQLLSKQGRHQWFEMPSCLLWRHCNGSESVRAACSVLYSIVSIMPGDGPALCGMLGLPQTQ